MRIAFIGQKGIPAIRGGGVEVYVENLATGLAKAGHNVTVYSRAHYSKRKQREFFYKGVRVIQLPTIPNKYLDAWIHTLLATLHACFCNYDIIHYQAIGPTSLSFIARFFSGAKIFATFHCRDYEHEKWGFFSRLYLRISEFLTIYLPHEVITPSEILKKYVKDTYKKEIIFIPQGVKSFNDPKRLNLDKKILAKFNLLPKKYLLIVSRFVSHKGIHFAIEMYKDLPKVFKDEYKLVIVGDSSSSYTKDYEKKLKSAAKGQKNIIFLGFQSGKTLEALFSNAYLFIQPSKSEGLSIALLESFAACVPAFVNNIEENLQVLKTISDDPEFIKNFSCDVRDKKIFTRRINYLLMHPDLVQKWGKISCAKISQIHLWENLIAQYEIFYAYALTQQKFTAKISPIKSAS